MTECPRCEAAVIREGFGALSRVTRDEGAPVMVCDRCGERESLYGRDPAGQIPMTDWPVPVETLVTEEHVLITRFRESEFAVIPADRIVP